MLFPEDRLNRTLQAAPPPLRDEAEALHLDLYPPERRHPRGRVSSHGERLSHEHERVAELFARARQGLVKDARNVRCPACGTWQPAPQAATHVCAKA